MYRPPSRTEQLESELSEAQADVRRLTRDLKKESQKLTETSEAYSKMVANLVRTVHENTVLRYECERLKRNGSTSDDQLIPALFGFDLTRTEVAAIRKAIARIHHPDAGGDIGRMQAWNVMLDKLEEQLEST
jgi:chromosome segregation ATPase